MRKNTLVWRKEKMPTNTDTILEIKSLTKRFGGVTAVNDVSLSVKKGTVHGIIGPNGSGKTTLFNCVTGVYKAQTGSVVLDGRRIDVLPTHKISSGGIARTFQGGGLFPDFTIAANLLAAQAQHIKQGMGVFNMLLNTKSYKAALNSAIGAQAGLLKLVGAYEDTINTVRSMSVKQQRLIEIARALACEPRVLLLDEPAAGMDPVETQDLSGVIKDVRAAGLTVVLIEHDMKLAMGVCDYVSVLSSGKLIAEGTPSEIQNNPIVVEAYLGKTGKVEITR
jgi:branched-chain amino acid transport system ATP-binding protein